MKLKLKRLQQGGIFNPIQHADWAAPIMPVVKEDRSARICGDYHLADNHAAKPDTFPLPRVDDIFVSLLSGKAFSNG